MDVEDKFALVLIEPNPGGLIFADTICQRFHLQIGVVELVDEQRAII